MAFPEDIQSNTPAKYLFKLVGETDTVICNVEPLEWASGTLEMKRDLELGGVFITFQTSSLTFVGNGAEFLRNLFINAEINAKCTLIIYWWKDKDFTTPANGRTYIEFPTRFDINFNCYETVKIAGFAFGVRVKAVNNSVQTKLDSRQDIDIDITKLKSIGGELNGVKGADIIEYPFVLKKGLHYDSIDMWYTATLNRENSNSELNHIADVITFTSIPLTRKSNEFAETEVQSVSYMTKKPLSAIPSFFKNALYEHDFVIHWMVNVYVRDRYYPGSAPWNIQIIETDAAGVELNPYPLGGFGNQNNKTTYYLHGNEPIKVHKGCDLKFVIQSPGIDASYSAYLIFQQLIIIENVISSPAKLTYGFPIYDAMERVLQHIMDVQYPFYSEFFGREDVFYNSQFTLYTAEDQLRFAHIQSGLNQRGLAPYNPSLPNTEGAALILNFKDLFKSLKALWNVGYSLETLFGELSPRVRIEEYAYFFQNVEIVFDPPLSERVNKYDIQSQVMPELVPNNLKSGFDSFEYLSVNGRAEPNTTNQRTSVMNTATKFENISPLRGDTKGIIDNLSSPIEENETIDTKGDSDVFIVKSQRDGTYDWIPETDTNISIDNESSLFGESLLNRYFTPSRMLIRHGNRIKSGMTKLDAASVLRFQKTDKDSSLETSGEGINGLKENSDILVSSLAAPIYKPIKHTIECMFTKTDLELLKATPLRYMDFGPSLTSLPGETITGYLLHLKMKNNEDRADITIIEKYIPPPS